MGHSHSKNNEKDSAPAYIPDFEVMRMIESHNYGRAKLVCDTKTGTHMILREFLFDNKQAFEKEVKSFEEKGAFEHPNIIQIIGYYTTEANNFCSRFFKVSVFIEEPHESLENKIKERVKSGLRYSDEEILTVADNLVSALSHLQQTKDLSHGDIRPANVYVSGQNYKITDPKLEVDQNANMLVKAMINGSKAYLSPALLKQVPTGAFEPTEDKHKADVFALGATLLYMATLKDNEELYSYETGEFYEGVLHHRLHHVQHYYSPFTYDLIRDMLEVDEHHRPCLNNLRERLAGFSGEHHHHHHDCNSKGWEQGRFRFVGEAGDDQKLVSWKYKQEARLGYEQRVKEGNLRKKMEEEELEHARRREKEHQEMHKKMKEQHKEIIKKSHEEKEHALKSFAAPHTHEEDHHVHEHKEVSPILPNQHLTLSSHVTTPHITQPSSYTPTHSHQHIQFDHAFLSARSTKKEEEERELARKQEEYREFMRKIDEQLGGLEKTREHGTKEHVVKSARVPQIHEADHHIQAHKKIEEITQVQPQHHVTISSHVIPHITQPISASSTHNHHHMDWDNTPSFNQANAQPTYFGVANIYSSANIHSPVESPVRTSHYQGNYSGAVDRNSVKTEHSVEENIASYNYALGGSPLRQRNTRSTKFSIQQDELNHSFGTNESPLQGHNLLEDLKQFNLSQSQTYTPSHGQNFQAASLNGHMATSIHAPGRNIY